MIVGIGIDIIEIDRVEQAISRERFRARVFSPDERAYCDQACSAERYAGRFAAKEAVAKALSCSLNWREVEILTSESGAPVPRLHGRALEHLGSGRLHVSISHSRLYAVAQAIVEREG